MLIDENDKLEYKEKVSKSLPKEIVSFLNSESCLLKYIVLALLLKMVLAMSF